MTCYACHSAWTTSCFGCHLSMKANQKKPMLHNEGGDSRNWTSYNFQTLRDDIYFLAKDGTVTKNRIAPARSACAVLVSSQNQNREWIYSQQQTVSSAGFSGQAFSTYVPHTVRGEGDQGLHATATSAAAGDNNAWMAQLLMQGTGSSTSSAATPTWARAQHGFEAVAVTERDEPQAVIGSRLHELAYPDGVRAPTRRAGGRCSEALPPRRRRALAPAARRVPVRGPGHAAGCASTTWRRSTTRASASGIVSAPVSPLGPAALRGHEGRDLGRAARHDDDRPRAQGASGQRGAARPPALRLRLRDRPRGGPGRGRPARTRLLDGDPTQQLRRARGHLQRRRRARRAPARSGSPARPATSRRRAGSSWSTSTTRCSRALVAQVGAPLRAPRAVAVQFRYAFVLDERRAQGAWT